MADKLNVKVGMIGAFDMLKFKNMAKVREAAIQAAPANEIKGEFPINQNAKALHPDYLDLVVDQVETHEGAAAKTFHFKSQDGGPLPFFRAGQYLSVKQAIGKSFITRPISISSSPADALKGSISLTVKDNPSGFFAPWALKDLKKGDKVRTSAPEGQFYWEELRDSKDVLALAGGSGITPFMSMAKAIRDGIEDFNLTIIFGSAKESAILYKTELDGIVSMTDGKVKVVHVLSDDPENTKFERGFITADLIKKYYKKDASIFVCGPEAMYKFVEKEIAKLNIPGRLVRRELLGVTKHPEDVKGFPAAAKGKTFNITVKQGAQELKIKAASNEPVLVALERAGIKAPSRCRSGECGWCRSKLVKGTVFVPAENEGRRHSDIVHGYIHPCATFATSDLVIEVPGEYV